MAAPSSEPGPAQGPITDDGAAPPARGAARRAGGGRDRRIVAEALDGDEGLVEEAFRRGRGVGGQGGELLESTPDGLRLAQQGGRTSRSRHPRDSRRRLLGRCGTDELTRRRPACLRVTRTPRLGGERDGPASVDGPSEVRLEGLESGVQPDRRSAPSGTAPPGLCHPEYVSVKERQRLLGVRVTAPRQRRPAFGALLGYRHSREEQTCREAGRKATDLQETAGLPKHSGSVIKGSHMTTRAALGAVRAGTPRLPPLVLDLICAAPARRGRDGGPGAITRMGLP
jgi:hypothetical protein